MCTGQALIIGVHDPAYSNGASFGKVNTDIGRVADYMMYFLSIPPIFLSSLLFIIECPLSH